MTKFELTEQEAIKLGSYLKNKREELGYSTNYIEMYTGINKADISRIENGKKKKINPFYLKELANILKLNQIELFNIAGYIENSKFKETKIQSLAITLKLLRESRNLSMEELANKAGVSKGIIGEIERSKTCSTMKTLNKIANALNLSEIEKNKLDSAFVGREFIENKINLKNTISLTEIPVYVSVSAGCGRIPESEPIDYISLPEATSDCIAIKVEGESMEPTLSPEDLIVLKKEMEVKIGDIGVFLNKTTGESFVKRLKKKNGTYILESDNSYFEDIEINTDEICCCGKVINIVKNDLKKKIDPIYEKLELLDINQQKIIEMMIESLLENKKR